MLSVFLSIKPSLAAEIRWATSFFWHQQLHICKIIRNFAPEFAYIYVLRLINIYNFRMFILAQSRRVHRVSR